MKRNVEMKEGHMYQVIEDKTVEVVRWGDVLLPITNPLVHEIVGQLTLELYDNND